MAVALCLGALYAGCWTTVAPWQSESALSAVSASHIGIMIPPASLRTRTKCRLLARPASSCKFRAAARRSTWGLPLGCSGAGGVEPRQICARAGKGGERRRPWRSPLWPRALPPPRMKCFDSPMLRGRTAQPVRQPPTTQPPPSRRWQEVAPHAGDGASPSRFGPPPTVAMARSALARGWRG